jgi:hypothetical protein
MGRAAVNGHLKPCQARAPRRLFGIRAQKLRHRFPLLSAMREKLEQASKVKSWMPTCPLTGEGRADREERGGLSVDIGRYPRSRSIWF